MKKRTTSKINATSVTTAAKPEMQVEQLVFDKQSAGALVSACQSDSPRHAHLTHMRQQSKESRNRCEAKRNYMQEEGVCDPLLDDGRDLDARIVAYKGVQIEAIADRRARTRCAIRREVETISQRSESYCTIDIINRERGLEKGNGLDDGRVK